MTMCLNEVWLWLKSRCSRGQVTTIINNASSSCTEVKMIKSSHTWKIKNFSLLEGLNNDEALTSESFFAEPNNSEHKCCIRMYRNFYVDKDYISLYLVFASSNKPKVRPKVKFSILNANRKEIYVPENPNVKEEYEGKDQILGFSRFIQKDFLLNKANGLIQDGNLTILCEISFVSYPANILEDNALKFEVPEKCELSSNIGSLFQDQILTDVTISVIDKSHFDSNAEASSDETAHASSKRKKAKPVSGREYKAHKAILAARSPVFARMFQSEMEENKSNKVEVTDVDPDVFREMLLFIYTKFLV